MIKQLRFLCTLLLIAVASAAWGDEVTFTPGTDTGETSVTKNGVTVTLTTMNNANYYQIYANQSGTFSISEGSITKIEFTCTASGTAKYGPGNASANDGSYSYSENTGTWTGSASSVTISSTVQIRMSSLTITYTTSGDTPTPTTYTVTYNANGGTGTMTDPNSPYEEDAEVTLLTNTFTAPTDMIWDSWEVKDADANDITVTGGKFTMPASNVTVKAQWVADPNAPQYNWVLTDFADLTSSDIFVIVGNNGSTYAMRNDGGTNAPVVSAVTIANNMISGTVADNIKWNVSGNATNGYTFNPNGATTTLYCLDSNNGLRIGTGSGTYSDVFFMDASGYLKATIGSVTRYVGIYNSQDWRCYTSPTTNNIKDQTFAFYKRVDANAPQTPSFTISDNNELDYDATSGSFNFEVNNPVNDGTTTVSENVEWISDATISGNSVTFTTTANEATTSRSGVITLTYTYGNNQTVTKEVTVTQAAAPVCYTTIPDLFNAATATETDVKVTFNNWVVSGVSTNGKNVFVTDNNGNGFVIYSSSDVSSTYAVGDVLSGTAVECKLVLYHGFAEIKGLNAEDLTITTGGTVSVADIDLANLAGVNTGALVSYENLTCNVTTTTSGENTTTQYFLTDGTTTLQVFNSLYAFEALEDGKTYNITGIYQQYNNTKEILPRSADDIVLVEDDREDPGFAFNPAELNITQGEDYETPEFDDPEGLIDDVEFTTTNASVASWDATDGLVLGGATGTATITATFEGDEYYMPGTATLTVTVNQAQSGVPEKWILTDLADLTENDVFVIVGNNGDNYAMSNDNGASSAPAAVAVTISDDKITSTVAENIKWNISIAEDGYTFYPNGTTETWLYCTNANNGVRVGTNDNKTFTVSEEGYLVNAATSRYVGIYSSQDWRCYTSINSNIKGQTFSFYKKVEPETETITVKAGFPGTTYSSNRPLDFTNVVGLAAYIITDAEGTTQPVTKVPANTGLYLEVTETAAEVREFKVPVTSEDVEAVEGNLLIPTDGTQTVQSDNTTTYYAYGKQNGKYAFFKVSATKPYTPSANKALLAVPTEAGAKDFIDVNGGATSIEAIDHTQSTTGNNEIYNLAGQRVAKAQKGVYIVNGKKIVIR